MGQVRRRPGAMVLRLVAPAALALYALLRLALYLATYHGPAHGVNEVVLEQRGFVSWQGEELAVRGRIVRPGLDLPACGLRAVELADADLPSGPRLTVLYHAPPHWLGRLLALPALGALLPTVLPEQPSGVMIVAGHLQLAGADGCGPLGSYVLMADTLQ